MSHVPVRGSGWLQRWNAIPLYLQILLALVVGLMTGSILGERAHLFDLPAKLLLQLLGALAPPLIFIAVTHVLMTTDVKGTTARRLAGLLLTNTLVAILIGLLVANVVRPGKWGEPLEVSQNSESERKLLSPVDVVIDNLPRSLIGPFGDQPKIIGVIFIAISFGVALRVLRNRAQHNAQLVIVESIVEVAYKCLVIVLHWIIALVPLGVFAIVASVVGVKGFSPLYNMLAFVVAVLLALLLQVGWYLLRIRTNSWCRPMTVLRGMRDALVMAFSTGSSTATMPVTYACLKDKVGVREESASLGSLVGANFNNDGTALYEAMSALFISQMIGRDLSLSEQLIVILTSIVASVGAAGIPEAGIVTMYLVFRAVGLPTEYIPLLLTVDWFLDRCRTAINVFGDVNVSCLLDGKTPPTPVSPPVAEPAPDSPPSAASAST